MNIGIVRRWGASAVVLAWLVACSSESAVTSPSSIAAPTDDAQDASVAPQSTGNAPRPDAAGACEELGGLQATNITASFDSGEQWFWGPVPGRTTPTRLGVLASASAAQSLGQTVQLGVGAEANYATCTHCMAVAVGCIGDDCSQATWFFAKSGTARFDQVATSPGGAFNGEFDDVRLTQVTIDPATYTSTEVAGGGCFHVPKLVFQATTWAASSLTDGGPSGGGTSSDAGDGGNGNNGNHGGRGGGGGGAVALGSL